MNFCFTQNHAKMGFLFVYCEKLLFLILKWKGKLYPISWSPSKYTFSILSLHSSLETLNRVTHLTPTSCTELKTGQSRCVDPPLPGDAPPTRLLPYSMACWLWKLPKLMSLMQHRENERASEWVSEREWERERVCVCECVSVCLCVCVCVCVCLWMCVCCEIF